MSNDKLEELGNTQASRRSVLKGLLLGLGAGVLVQVAGGVTASAQTGGGSTVGQKRGEDAAAAPVPKAEKNAKKSEKGAIKEEHKVEKNKTDQGKQAKGKGEKKKTEEPKAQHKK